MAFADKPLVLFRGAVDLATGSIVRLHNAGYRVIALEVEKPLVIRRTVALADAVFDGEKEVEGVKAVLFPSALKALDAANEGIVPVLIDPECSSLEVLKPDVVVDATLAKRNIGTNKAMASLTIALGPGYEAGVDVDVVVETKRGHDLGRLIRSGFAEENTGIPGLVMGYGKERVIHSPAEGIFQSEMEIGDIVKNGDAIGYVDGKPVVTVLSGKLRGLIRPGMYVSKGLKIADVDPRGVSVDHMSISDKARAVAGGVLEAVDNHFAFCDNQL